MKRQQIILIRELLTTDGFIRHFFKIIRDNPLITQTEAYEKTEEVYQQMIGKRRFSNFDSFRQVKKRYLKRK